MVDMLKSGTLQVEIAGGRGEITIVAVMVESGKAAMELRNRLDNRAALAAEHGVG